MKKILLVVMFIFCENLYTMGFNAENPEPTLKPVKRVTKLIPIPKRESSIKKDYNDLCIFNMEMIDSTSSTGIILEKPISPILKKQKSLRFANTKPKSSKTKHSPKKSKKKAKSSLDLYFSTKPK